MELGLHQLLGPPCLLFAPLSGLFILGPPSRASWWAHAPRLHRGAHTEPQLWVGKEEDVVPEARGSGGQPSAGHQGSEVGSPPPALRLGHTTYPLLTAQWPFPRRLGGGVQVHCPGLMIEAHSSQQPVGRE